MYIIGLVYKYSYTCAIKKTINYERLKNLDLSLVEFDDISTCPDYFTYLHMQNRKTDGTRISRTC